MSDDEAKKRIAAIESMQVGFDNKLASLDKDLLAVLLENADTILANPSTISRILGQFENKYHVPVLQQFGLDILAIKDLNDAYFQGAIGETMGGVHVNTALFEQTQLAVEKLITERFGIAADGEIVSNGLFDLFSQDTTVRRQIQQFAFSQKASGIGLERFKKTLKGFIAGEETATNPAVPARGIWSRHYDTVAYDIYQQADRVAQQSFADGLNMSAFLYLGGKIPSSRIFCVIRDGKCFLKSEIDKMGTSADKYGGYANKSVGYFLGKPKSNYAPFTDAGGHNCRHHWSAISDREALRRRDDLAIGKNGVLYIKS